MRRPFRKTPSSHPDWRGAISLAVSLALGTVSAARAGDLLRGGGSSSSQTNAPTAMSGAVTAQTMKARSSASDSLARATATLRSIQAMQQAARNLALNTPARPQFSSVSDGLVAGGLVPDSGLQSPGVANPTLSWTGAANPIQTKSNDGIKISIVQTQSQAVLNWQSFNIGKKTTVTFNQTAGGKDASKWIAFNKITDPSGNPTQILGRLDAVGQVYLINQNGIVFGGSSQINLHNLTASTLPINDNLINRGLLNNPDAQFLFSSLAQPAGSKGPTAAFTPPASTRADGKIGDVIVEQGAILSSPTTPGKVGGRITLIGANVKNEGTISTPDGQTILAAGLQVGFDAHPGSDPSLRGLDVSVGQVTDPTSTLPAYAGTATNSGLISVPRGNVTIIGKDVRQLSVITSSTSTSLNGRADLLASYGATTNPLFDSTNPSFGPLFQNQKTGTIELGTRSQLLVLPETENPAKIVGTQLALTSQVNLQGKVIHFSSDSQILAPNANVSLNAGNWVPVGSLTALRSTGGQIYFDEGATVDVSGSTNLSAPITENILTLQLRGAELADSPVQRTGALRAVSLSVDLRKTGTYNGQTWIGTPLGDVSGFAGLIQRTVGELTTNGGNVNLTAGEAVILQKESRIDVSGGWIEYEGGMVETSRVLENGRLVDIANATPDRVYDRIYTGDSTFIQAKYGLTETFQNPLALKNTHYETGYRQGANAGSIVITAPSMVLDGTLLGGVVQGERQSNSRSTALAKAGTLSLTLRGEEPLTPYLFYSPTPPNIVFADKNILPIAKPFRLDPEDIAVELSEERKKEIILSPDLLGEKGFGTLTIDNSDGNITLPQGVSLNVTPKGSITLSAANITIEGHITAPGGSLQFTVFDFSPYTLGKLNQLRAEIPTQPDPLRGVFNLGASASLNTAGLLTDYGTRPSNSPSTSPWLEGGSITINSYTARLAQGSLIDVSGGVTANELGNFSYGNAGSITINTGRDPNIPYFLRGELELGSTLKGFSGAKGGALTVQASLVQIGGALPDLTISETLDGPAYLIDGIEVARDELLYLQPEFFTQGGFTTYTINGLGKVANTGAEQFIPAISIAPNTRIALVAEKWAALPGLGAAPFSLQTTLYPEALRTPVSLVFGTPGTRNDYTGFTVLRGDFVLGNDATIETDTGASVTVRGDTAAILGSIYARAGNITIAAASSFPTTSQEGQTLPLPTVNIGPRSVLSVAGTTLLRPDPYDRSVGSVLAGGNITVSGNIVAEAGALLDVSGTAGQLDVAPATLSLNIGLNAGPPVSTSSGITAPLYSLDTVLTQVESNAGTITLRGAQELFTEATLRGRAGGPTALGGNLAVSSGRFVDVNISSNTSPLDKNLTVSQRNSPLAKNFYPADESAIGHLVPVKNGDANFGGGYFSLIHFEEGNFDTLKLSGIGGISSGAVQFSGAISLAARRSLTISDGGVIYADADVILNAPYVALGTPFQAPLESTELAALSFSGPTYLSPTYGTGSLTVQASLIDIGNLSLQDIGSATFIAERGDIRGNGVLDLAGSLELKAGQIYPTTASRFTIAAYDYVTGSTVQKGSIKISRSGAPALPLSAGGELNLYASNIQQGGTLRAPFGTINLGWDGTGSSPVDYLTGAGIVDERVVPVSQKLTLTRGSVTSVSAVDPKTGHGSLIPYGFSSDGNSWIDPRGVDISGGGAPSGNVNLSALDLSTQSGSHIDLRGGGDLYAYRWVTGNGGTRDILASTTSFAVVPDYEAAFAPYAPNNVSTVSTNLAVSDSGYVNNTLSAGDRIYLGASEGLAAGVYTLLPARYALLPGAKLVTPQTGAPTGTFQVPEGSTFVSGYRYNALNRQPDAPVQATRFEVASADVVRARAQYEDYLANSFLKERATALGIPTPRLPGDSGQLVFSAIQTLQIQGDIAGQALKNGRDALIDISSTVDILINSTGKTTTPGTVALNAAKLSSFGAESLLIGGTRQLTNDGTALSVQTGNITVDNAGTPLAGPEIVLVAKNGLGLVARSQIVQSGTTGNPTSQTLQVSSGNGLLLRVSDTPATVVRSGISSQADQAALAQPPTLTVGSGVLISGASLTLDSTYGFQLDSRARLSGNEIALNSGQIVLQFDNAGNVPNIAGLSLAGPALAGLQTAQSLSLLSYSSLDLYGSGKFKTQGALALRAAEIRGFTTGDGGITFTAPEIVLENTTGGTVLGSSGSQAGSLIFDTGTIRLGAGQIRISQFANVALEADRGVFAGASGAFASEGDLRIDSPLLTAASAVNYSITSAGSLDLVAPAKNVVSAFQGGLGATLSLAATSIIANSSISLPSGNLNLRATTGNLVVGNLGPARLDVSGAARIFNDLTRFTSGGNISLTSDLGSVTLDSQSLLSVSAAPGGGDAGSLSISSPKGSVVLGGQVDARGGRNGEGGSFSLEALSLPDLTSVDARLNAAAFDLSRSYRIRTGNVSLDGVVVSRNYQLSADQGSITVSGGIDSSGNTGGRIILIANGSVILQNGSFLTVAAKDFDNAGKGGDISLESGAQINGIAGTGVVDIQTGSRLDLSVATYIAGDEFTYGSSASLGRFTGKLHLRAPQTTTGTDLLVNTINGQITGASSILVEGYRLFDLTNTTGAITNTGTLNANGGLLLATNNVRGSINANAENFLGSAGTASAGSTAILDRLLGTDPQGLAASLVLAPGAEIIKRNGNLTLGTASSTTAADWNLASFRYGEKSAPGVLTLRASGNLVFYNALSDGFTPALDSFDAAWLYTAELSEQNLLLPTNTQSWSYRLTAGADFAASDFRRVQPIATLASNSGSLQLGKLVTNNNGNPLALGGNSALTSTAIVQRYQVIRTGSGDITISAGHDVQLLNQFATIYTAGTRVADPTLGGKFEIPPSLSIDSNGPLGAVQQDPTYAAQYSLAGGNISISARQDITHLTQTNGSLVADSQKQIPNNWLYRRGYVDPLTGQFGLTADGDIGSTTWWIDFSNFFEGIATLGGGNLSLTAGNDINNVDAAAATNARMTYQTATGDLLAKNQSLTELGGGDVTVRAGHDLDAGIYYVERGQGQLRAGNSIVTNQTRSTDVGSINIPAAYDPSPAQWLPTTLFLGKGSFDIVAARDVLLGPVVNPFLLPGGVNNSYSRKSYFSTYALTDSINVASLGGKITLRENSNLTSSSDDLPILQNWLQSIHRLSTNPRSLSFFQPWLRLDESTVAPFNTVFSLLPGTLKATAYSGDINLVGRFNLSPSPVGTLELLAGGAINGLQPTGLNRQSSTGNISRISWTTATINLSDADPASLPGINSPYAYQELVGAGSGNGNITFLNFLSSIDVQFAETGSSTGNAAVIQTRQALHGSTLLHADDPEPIRLYASLGNLSGLTLYSGKAARIFAENDITDVAFYLQNNRASDITVVSAGHDIIPSNANSLLRIAAQAPGNRLNFGENPLAGDIQIGGPGTLEVFAGRNLDLGTGSNNADGTGTGLTSIGNARNPNLPFDGADIVAGAGIGPAFSLEQSPLAFDAFIQQILQGPAASRYLGELSGSSTNLPDNLDPATFEKLDPELQAKVALEIFYLVLRDAGRNSSTAGDYTTGFSAIELLFGTGATPGDIDTRSRDIRTKSGGTISLFAPGGRLTLASSTLGNSLAPPGIITEAGGNISILTRDNVDIGISRIFTLRGGNEIIWSSAGNIAAGSSSKTVQSAPPTRVLIDPQSADVQTDLAGLATGGGIGVLATVEGVPPGSVDLIAPVGFVDAGDAGIRATGNLNIAAVRVLNADNIQVSGTSTGVPVAIAPPLLNLAVANPQNTNSGTSDAAREAQKNAQQQTHGDTLPSIITVEVLGYGG